MNEPVQRVRGVAHIRMTIWLTLSSTLSTSICRDGGVICLLYSFESNHTEAAKERDVYRL